MEKEFKEYFKKFVDSCAFSKEILEQEQTYKVVERTHREIWDACYKSMKLNEIKGRCKDCKHTNMGGEKYYCSGIGEGGSWEVGQDDYCSKFEPKMLWV